MCIYRDADYYRWAIHGWVWSMEHVWERYMTAGTYVGAENHDVRVFLQMQNVVV